MFFLEAFTDIKLAFSRSNLTWHSVFSPNALLSEANLFDCKWISTSAKNLCCFDSKVCIDISKSNVYFGITKHVHIIVTSSLKLKIRQTKIVYGKKIHKKICDVPSWAHQPDGTWPCSRRSQNVQTFSSCYNLYICEPNDLTFLYWYTKRHELRLFM